MFNKTEVLNKMEDMVEESGYMVQIKALILYVFHPKGKHSKILEVENVLPYGD